MKAFQKMETFIRRINRLKDRALAIGMEFAGSFPPISLGQMGEPAPLRLYSFPRGIRQR